MTRRIEVTQNDEALRAMPRDYFRHPAQRLAAIGRRAAVDVHLKDGHVLAAHARRDEDAVRSVVAQSFFDQPDLSADEAEHLPEGGHVFVVVEGSAPPLFSIFLARLALG